MAIDLLNHRVSSNRLEHTEIAGIALSPDGKLFCTASELETARVWDCSTLQLLRELRGHPQGVHAAAFSPNGKQVATGGVAIDAVKLWSMASGQQVLTLERRRGISISVRYSADGSLIGALNDNGELDVWRAPSRAEIEAAEKRTQEKAQ